MQKVLVICPSYGKSIEALSVHTKLMKQFFLRNYQVAVLTTAGLVSYDETESVQTHEQIIEVNGEWNFINLMKKTKEIRDFNPDKIFIQYVPFLYGRGGINFSFPLWVMLMRLLDKAKIEIYFHELYYPFEMKIKSMVMNVSHIIMLFILGLSAHHILVTTKAFEKILRRIFFLKKYIHFLPVGPNIEKHRIDHNACEEFRKKHNISSVDLVLGSFGTFHPSKNYHLIFEILKKIKTKDKMPVKFIMIGQDRTDLLNYLGEDDFKQLEDIVIATGSLNDSEINLAFAVMDAYLGYFMDGLSARRGSIMAAMQAGLPIISTISKTTEECFVKQAQVYLYDPDENIFSDGVRELIKHYGYHIKKTGKIKHVVFEDFFAWEKIFQTYEKYNGEMK